MKTSSFVLGFVMFFACLAIIALTGCMQPALRPPPPVYNQSSADYADTGGGDPSAFIGLMNSYGHAHSYSMTHCYVGALGRSLNCNSW